MVMTQEKNVLIVDDEEMLRWILSRKLSKEGYNCEQAADAEQALASLKMNPSDLVVLDINMPGKPGNELLPEIRAEFPDTAVVMASAVTDPGVIAQCIRDGAHDYVLKPFKLVDVLLSVSLALEKRRLELKMQAYQRKLGRAAEQQVEEMRKAFISAIEDLVDTLEDNDEYTAGHSRGVTDMSVSLGRKLGLDKEQMEDLFWGALLHDVGKIAVDPAILNKPGELTPAEYRHIMTHAMVGPALVEPFVNARVVDIISNHHAWFNGGGLDQTLVGEAIPLGARIVAVADAFDAMTSNRPYRMAMPPEAAFAELKRCSGTQFDPQVAGTLLQIYGDVKTK